MLALGQSTTEGQVYCQEALPVASGLAYQRGEGLPRNKKAGFICNCGHFSLCMREFLYFVTEAIANFFELCVFH